MWCTVELKTGTGVKEYIASSKFLETECGKPVTMSDLYFENSHLEVSWKTL